MVNFIEASDVGFTSGAQVGAFKGAVENLNNNDYHALDKYWSSSDLKCIASKSAQHFNDIYFKKDSNGNRVRREREVKETPEMTLGSLVHCLLLEPQNFEKDFFKMPDLNFRTNEGKATKEKLLFDNAGKKAYTDEMLIRANGMRESAMSNSKAREFLELGRKEAAYFWTCPFSNINFKAKLDQSSSKHFCELKTSYSSDPKEFLKISDNRNYDLSAYHYRQALKNVMGVEVPAYFIVVETESPYPCVVFEPTEEFWEIAHDKWLYSVERLEIGLTKDLWPGYVPDNEVVPLSPPPWKIKKTVSLENPSSSEELF